MSIDVVHFAQLVAASETKRKALEQMTPLDPATYEPAFRELAAIEGEIVRMGATWRDGKWQLP